MSTTTIAVDLPQPLQALAHANRVRAELRDIRAWLREPRRPWDSRERCAQLLTGDPLPALANVLVSDLLTWCRGLGAYSAQRILAAAEVSETRRVGWLTARQSFALAGQLRHGYHDQLDLALARAASEAGR